MKLALTEVGLLVAALSVLGPTTGILQVADYRSAQFWRIYDTTSKDIQTLQLMDDSGDLDIMATTLNTVDILLKNGSMSFVKEELDKMNKTYNVVVDDVQETIIKEKQTTVATLNNTNCQSEPCMDWTKYYRLEDIYNYLDHLQKKFPQWVEVETMGLTSEGRPIKLLKISAQPNNTNTKAIWVDGGIHAREWITPASATYIAHQLVSSLEANLTTFSGLHFYILPVMNPDGYEYSHTSDRFWRKNRSANNGSDCLGTDLNRNWDYEWGGRDSKVDPCSSNYRGVEPFSESETAAVSSYILNNTSGITAYLSLHSYGQNILFPWAYSYSRPADYKELYELAYFMSYQIKTEGGPYYRIGTAAESYYIASGGSQDWAKGKAKIKLSFTMELRDTGRFAFSLPATEILKTAKDAFAAFSVISATIKR